jgi:hypothetical protein
MTLDSGQLPKDLVTKLELIERDIRRAVDDNDKVKAKYLMSKVSNIYDSWLLTFKRRKGDIK